MTNEQWGEVADLVCQILTKVYVQSRDRFEREAAQRKASVEQLAAAAITRMIREQVEGETTDGEGERS